MADNYVSLASSTGSAIESASKHNLQCKVSTDHILQWVQDASTTGESATTIVKKDKMNYTMHKNDIVVGVRGGWFPESITPNRAYPHVVTTYAGMCVAAQYWLLRLYNNAKSMKDVRALVNERLYHRGDGMPGLNHPRGLQAGVVGSDRDRAPLLPYEQQQIESMPQFYFMGVSLGLAYAHPDSGDTVGTVMYGGLRTVQNGPVTANTGQPVMWIFEFEAACFDTMGRRIHSNRELPDVIEDGLSRVAGQIDSTSTNMDMKTLDRKRFYERENANFPGYAGKRNVFYVVPYVRGDDYEENILDRERVFGTYISSARPFEMVDLKLQRQAI